MNELNCFCIDDILQDNMMNISICIKEKKLQKNIQDAVNEYIKRLCPYCKICIVFFSSEKELLKIVSGKYVICIDDNTDMISSEELADKLNNYSLTGSSSLAYIINYEYSSSNEHLSLASISLSSDMKALLLSEQIYRAYRINNNQPYHK